MANFLSNGGIELIMGTIALIYMVIRTHIKDKRPEECRIK